MKAYIYILKDQKGKFYIGSTIDLERRLKQHTNGHTQTTRNMVKPTLVLKQEVSTLPIARMVEMKIKKMKRKDYIEKIVADGYIKLVG